VSTHDSPRPTADPDTWDVTRPRAADYLPHAEFRARERPSGIGCALLHSGFQDGRRVRECIVTDGDEWHYVTLLATGGVPYPNVSAEDVEQAVERFAASLPASFRIRHLINASPLHVDGDGHVFD
jgi:hypothetical protein